MSDGRSECEKSLIREFREAEYDRAAACLENDLDRCLPFHPFPEAHGSHLRTTKLIESVFCPIRLRTNAAKRFKNTKSGVYLDHQVIDRRSNRWRRLKSAHPCRTVPLPSEKPRPTTAAA